jgi:hypothetical protein
MQTLSIPSLLEDEEAYVREAAKKALATLRKAAAE